MQAGSGEQQYVDGEGGDYEPQPEYDPNRIQSYVGEDGKTYYYYYQDEGATDEFDSEQNPMQEFYAAAAQGAADERHDDATNVVPSDEQAPLREVAETLARTYEYEDYTPPSQGWLIDVTVEVFYSLAFRLYLSFIHCVGGAVILLLLVSYSYATLYRSMEPPISVAKGGDSFWQSMAYVTIFILQSIVSTAIICTWMDMLKGLWGSTRTSTTFWGLSHGKGKPPYLWYCLIFFFAVIFPSIWAFIETIADGYSVLRIASSYFYISTIVAMWYVALCFVWFYWQSLVEKRAAYARRFQSDDLRETRVVHNGRAERRVKSKWYYSESALEEYGLEPKTIEWSAPVFILGLVPIFSMLIGIARQSRTDTPTSSWTAVGVLFLSVLLLLFQMVTSKNHRHRTVFFSIFLIVLLLILGLIGCGVSSSGGLWGVLIVLAVASQFLLLRKRQHYLTRKEVCALLNIAIEREDEEKRVDQRFDTYMCCCRNTWFALFQWLDIRSIFGYRHPKVREFEKQRVIQHPTLRSDYKVLLVWWITLFGCLCFVLGINTQLQASHGESQAGTSIGGTLPTPSSPLLCNITFDSTSTTSSLRLIDLAMFATLGSSYGDAADQNYAQWFYQYNDIVREIPTTIPATKKLLASSGNDVPYYVYHNTVTDFRVIVLHQSLVGTQLLQGVDYWGEVIALQIAGVISPWVASWSVADKQAFISGAKFFKNALNQDFDPLASVTAYIRSTSSYTSKKVVVVGDGFNGGYAKILSRRLDIDSVSFNAPGVSLLSTDDVLRPIGSSGRGIQVDLDTALLKNIDVGSNEVESTFSLPCSDNSAMICGSASTVVAQLIRTCGDIYGRRIVG